MNNSPHRLVSTATATPLMATDISFPSQRAREFDAALMTFAH
ncbi:hypothetical protein SAMN03159382_01811 [Pseudomonas sp. NFACC23-1]|nr:MULTISPECIES: hypothetical protein [unclassified Pseudomonas]SDB20077.1 hypothetical protein SAMN03159386_01450 [Pseudomonas sp. NFACC17-2]SEJ27431.1 hypothetical protein SAMN03159382_01811 [Pseudomonas sp. NFACC23-1]SFW78619.1 hypothetical protein SAMN05660640_03584 [Pseudomonas sp. NFACC16-2]